MIRKGFSRAAVLAVITGAAFLSMGTDKAQDINGAEYVLVGYEQVEYVHLEKRRPEEITCRESFHGPFENRAKRFSGYFYDRLDRDALTSSEHKLMVAADM